MPAQTASQETLLIFNFLVVEDEPVNRQLLLTMLVHLGHRVIEASNGLEALQVLAAVPDAATLAVDVVLLDLHMAQMDGFDVLVRLRGNPATRNLPVICISAHARQEDQEKALRLGADAYIVKPFRRQQLIVAVDGALLRLGLLAPGTSIGPS